MDWVKFKSDTGLEDELAHNNKDRYSQYAVMMV